MLFPRTALPPGPQPYLSAKKGMAKVKGGKSEIRLDKLFSPVIMSWIFSRRRLNFPYFLAFRE
jgi:hypothetical protein